MFEIDSVENGGRSGILNINGVPIDTPINILTKTDLTAISNFSFVKEDEVNSDLGVNVKWITKKARKQLKKEDNFNDFINDLKKPLHKGLAKNRINHFEFSNELKSLNFIDWEKLFEAQVKSEADVLEIPNFLNNKGYSQVLENGINYFKKHSPDSPIMALVCKREDFDIINRKINDIDCVGVNLREQRNIKRLLYGVRELLRKNKTKDIWIHSFSTPRSYKLIQQDGTPGIGINRFGIDTMSFPVWMGGGTPSKETVLKKHRYYNPDDYGTLTWNLITESNQGVDVNLSDFCGCPLCNKYTLIDVIEDYSQEPSFSRAHESLSHNYESKKLRRLINNPDNSAFEYINSKNFARDFFSRIT